MAKKKTEKQKAIEELIKKQREFMAKVNKSGYTDKEYWLEQGKYRDRQAELAKVIHKEAHKKYWDEYRDVLKADIGHIDEDHRIPSSKKKD
jgi:hypothetical protein